MVRCPACGNRNPAEFHFCGFCGHPLGEAPAPEKRWATILFYDLSNFSRFTHENDLEVTHREVNEHLSRCRRCVDRHGGQIDKFFGDGMVAVFGASNSRENEPLNALRAARCMVEQRTGALEGRAGVTTGMVMLGPLGGGERAHQTVIGDAVNLAQRMVSSAPSGAIWIDETTRDLVPEARARFVGKRLFKGFADPQPVWEFLDWGGNPQPLFGREEELRRLLSLIDEGITGPGRLIWVVGPLGSGKSRLVAEALRLRSGRLRVIRIPELGVSDPVRRKLHLAFTENFGEDPLGFMRQLGLGELDRRIIGYVLGLESERPAPLHELGTAIAGSVRRVMAMLSRDDPLVLLTHLSSRTHPLVRSILDSLRNRPLERVSAIVMHRGSSNGADVSLGPLAAHDAAAYLESLNPGLDPEERRRILRESGGNPLIIRFLANADHPRMSVLAAFQSRLDRLPETHRQALLYAALGRPNSWYGVLQELLGADEAREAVEHLVKAGYLKTDATPLREDSRLDPANPLLQRAARELLTTEQQRQGHATYWRWLSNQHKRFAPAAAEHAELAEMPVEAGRSWIEAAEYHRIEGVFAAADKYYERAITVAPEPIKSEALRRRVEMHLTAGSAESALELLAGQEADWAQRLRGLAYASLGRRDEARALLPRFLEQNPNDVNVRLALYCLEEGPRRLDSLGKIKKELDGNPKLPSRYKPSVALRLAETLAGQMRLEEAGRAMREAYEGFVSIGNRSRAAEAALALAGYMWYAERMAGAAEWADKAIEHGRLAHPGLATTAWSVRAGLWLDQGRSNEAERALKQAELHLEHARNANERARIHAIRMRFLIETGKVKDAVQLGEKVFAGLPHPWLAANLALAYAVHGGSGTRHNELMTGFMPSAPPPGKTLFLLSRALQDWRQGESPIAHLKEALKVGRASGPYLRYLTLSLWGVYLVSRQPKRALALAQHLQRRSSSGGFTVVNQTARLLRAEIALAAGEPVAHLLRFEASLPPQQAWQQALLVRAGLAVKNDFPNGLTGYGILGTWARLSWQSAGRAKRHGPT